MLNKVEVRTALGMLLVLTLDDVSDGIILQDIQSLDPVKATLVSSTFANLDGARFQTSRRDTRNIMMVLGLEPDYAVSSVRELRNTLYAFFMPETQVSLRFFMEDGFTVDITGIIESCESPLFTSDPEMHISIVCFDPDFTALAPVVVSGNTVSTTTEFVITYDGTIPVGIKLTLAVNRSLSDFTIYHRPADEVTRTLDFSSALLSGDSLVISTITGDKRATRTRSSVVSSVLYGVSPQSDWIQLRKGDNHIRVYATGAAIPFTLEYTPRYGGL